MRELLIAVFMVVLAGCATLDPVAGSYRTITATRVLCSQYLERGRISVERAEDCLAQTDAARTLLDAAAAAEAVGNMDDARARLRAVDAVLGELERNLQRGSK